MAERDPTLPQSADPELQADLVRLLQVQGPLGMLNVLDVVIPVVSMGQVVPLDVELRQPSFRSTDVFSTGIQVNQPNGTVLADTGQLAAGVFDIQLTIQSTRSLQGANVLTQHRNAANAANLAVWSYLVAGSTQNTFLSSPVAFAYEFGLNERLRVLQNTVPVAGEDFLAVIFARRRA